MGEKTVWTGLPCSGRAMAAVELALANSRKGRLTWWIVDSRTRSDRVERSLLQASPNGVAGVEVILDGQLAQRVLDSVIDLQSAVSPAMRELVFRALLGESALHDRLAAPDSAGWARKASQLYDRANGNAANPINLERIRRVLPWLNELFLRYGKWLEERDLVDEASLPDLALDEIERGQPELPDCLIIDRMPEPSEAVIRLLQKVSEISMQTTVLVDSTHEAPAANLGRWFVERLDAKQDWTEKPFPSGEERVLFAGQVFAARGVTNHSSVDTEIWFHRDEASEIASVIRDASEWIHGQHLSEEDVAIVCADAGDSLPRLRELAPSYGLRLNAPLVKPMMARPLTALILDLVKLRTGGLDRARLTSLLVNPLVKYGDLLRNSSDVLLLDSSARAAGIRGGRGGFDREWAKPLQGSIDRHHVAYRKSDDPEVEERRRKVARDEADRLQSMLGELRELNDQLQTLPNPCTPAELRTWLDDCLRGLGVFAAIHMSSGNRGDLDERLTYGRLDILLNNLEKLHGVGGERRTLATWSDLLHQGLRRMTVSKPQRIRCGVQVLSAADLPGLRCKVMFFVGLTDSNWPSPAEVDLLEPFSRESTVNSLPTARALLLEGLLCADHVRLSCPCPQTGEHHNVPSPLLVELLDSGVGKVVAADADPPVEVYRSHLDLLPTLGRGWFSSDETVREVTWKRFAAASSEPGRLVAWPMAYHGVRVEGMRQNPETLTRYEGQLGDTDIGSEIALRFAREHVSPTRLDAYAQCPMQFFHKYVLGVEELRDVEDEVEPMTLGSLIHDILADTVNALRDLRGSRRVDLGENPEESARVMHETAERHIAIRRQPSVHWEMVADDLLSGLIDDRPAGRLKRLLDKELPDAKYPSLKDEIITHVEAGFGMPPEEKHEVLMDEPLRLQRDGEEIEFRGRIDRIGLSQEKGFRVWDYKTGSTTPATLEKKVAKGLSFQLPVYLWALQQAMQDGYIADLKDIDQAGYLMVGPDKISFAGKIGAKDFAKLSDFLLDRVFGLRRSIAAARFHHPLSQESRLCNSDAKYNYCSFKNACRRDHFLFTQRETRLRAEMLKAAYLFDFQPNLLAKQGGEA